MRKIVRLTESDIQRIIRRVIKEQSTTTKSLPHARAEFIDIIKDIPNWTYNPLHRMKEFAFIPNKGDIGYDGFKQDSFFKYTGKPLIFSGPDDTTYCFLDKRGNFIFKELNQKKSLSLLENIDAIKNLLLSVK